ncbi:MAG TPA: hypothetical protein VGP57_05035, partial [Actinoplanes sp.]|nr:hypothetical protein [Actinoplanes sp.]
AGYGDGIPDEEAPTFEDAAGELDPVAASPGGGFEPFDKEMSPDPPDEGTDGDDLEIAVEPVAEQTAPRRPRRGARRQPVPA